MSWMATTAGSGPVGSAVWTWAVAQASWGLCCAHMWSGWQEWTCQLAWSQKHTTGAAMTSLQWRSWWSILDAIHAIMLQVKALLCKLLRGCDWSLYMDSTTMLANTPSGALVLACMHLLLAQFVWIGTLVCPNEMPQWVARAGTSEPTADGLDCCVAADVFVYIGDLHAVLRTAAEASNSGWVSRTNAFLKVAHMLKAAVHGVNTKQPPHGWYICTNETTTLLCCTRNCFLLDTAGNDMPAPITGLSSASPLSSTTG